MQAILLRSIVFIFPVLVSQLFAEEPARPGPKEPTLMLDLWKNGPPGMIEGSTPGADDGTGRWRNVAKPGVLVYQPDTPAPDGGRIAIIACPGGGYSHLTRLAGADGAVAAFLPKNVVIISLKYRTRPPSLSVEEDAANDGRRAIRLVRHHAQEWGINPRKIGMLGWSAGANLCLNVASRFDSGEATAVDPIDRLDSRPDFVIMLSPWPHDKTPADYPISKDAPPAFIGSAEDDKTAPPAFARGIASSYQNAGANHHLWVVKIGGHGAFTINAPGEGGQWIDRLWPWLEEVRIRP